MSTPPLARQQLPTTSGDCEAQGCMQPWATLFPDQKFRPGVIEALFGPEHPGEVFKVCWPHYRMLRRTDGITLGYRKVNGKLRAYVKEYHI